MHMKMKHKQHYVWEHYLSAWKENGKVWCKRGGTIFQTSTENIGHMRDFYRIRELTDTDISIVRKMLIAPLSEKETEEANNWIAMFRTPHDMKRMYELTGIHDQEIAAKINVAINNLEEDWHALVESDACRVLAELRKVNTGALEDNQTYYDFMYFVAFQYTRTPRMMDKAVAALAIIPGFNAEASWGLMRAIISTRLARVLAMRKSVLHLTFLEAPNGSEFLAADQPLVNIQAVGITDKSLLTKFELYYPISPDLALRMDFQHESAVVERKQLSAAEVGEYNRILAGFSVEQIYAKSKSSFRSIGG